MRSVFDAVAVLCALAGIYAKCPPPFEPWVHGRCLQAQANTVTYDQAALSCQSELGVLASIHSAEDNANIAKATSQFQYHIYLGLQCNTTTNKFQWLDGSDLDYTNFLSEPTSCAGTPQVTFDPKTGAWTAYANAGYNSYLCEYVRDDEYPCDIGYDFIEESNLCVQPTYFPSTWNAAEAACLSIQNSHLVSIHDNTSNSAIAQYALSKNFTGGIHIGLSKQNDALTWSDGTAMDYSNFQPGMPIDQFGTCVAQRSQTSKWLSVHCDNTDVLPYLCAVPAFIPTSTVQPPGCPDSSYFLNQGDIYSPGYPISVDTGSLTCDYFLYGDEGTRVSLVFDVFELNSCCDSLEVYEGAVGGNPIDILTGEKEKGYQVDTFNDNIMHLVLKIGDGKGVRGFHGTFSTNDRF